VKRLTPTILVVCLLAATATAFAVTERLKLQDSPVLGTHIDHLFSPVCKTAANCHEATIAFRLRREENIRLDIADSHGTIVRRGVGSGVFGQAFHQFAWDGRNAAGRVVPDGIYRAELTLVDEGRLFEFPDVIQVDSTAPKIEGDIKIRHPVFSPDGDGRADRVDIVYRFSEPAYAILYLDGKRLPGHSYRKRPADTIQWYGLRDGKGLPPGSHRLALAAQDPAGNLSPSTREFTVQIRYVQLSRPRYIAHGGRVRVRISTDAKVVSWRLDGRAGHVRKHVFVLPVPRRAGRYRLTLTANGHVARATVLVRGSRR
jgi:hypothetical protein